MLPFTREQFVEIFARYNAAVWPSQVVAPRTKPFAQH